MNILNKKNIFVSLENSNSIRYVITQHCNLVNQKYFQNYISNNTLYFYGTELKQRLPRLFVQSIHYLARTIFVCRVATTVSIGTIFHTKYYAATNFHIGIPV